ncbi:uncharacterized protein LOC135597605 isoform X3 [Musa acuminata AAA Group]|uniref:uncharacterized protein LOC135597605 isoform X3 n=1 Tax=Musa acuminata AAA Group TaxID=214697 RepID=UPI0031E3BDBD
MQQRSVSASRRPSGTDGSDFSYRMVVDSRYTRVAKGKSRLGALLAAQVIKYQSTADMTYYELLDIGRTLIGVMLQILIIITTVSLVYNMSPKRIS